MRKLVLLAFPFLAITACESTTQPQAVDPAAALPSASISDAANGGVEGLYFLPPMASNPHYGGTFDGELSPIVEICATAACGSLHASFSMIEGDGSEVVRMEAGDEHYIVNWHAGETGAEAGETYRVRVLVNGLVLGYVDVTTVSTAREAVTVGFDGSIALVATRTLPVKFRIETGIPGAVVVTPAEATIDVGETQQFAAALYDLHGEPLIGPTIIWSSGDADVATVDEAGLATGVAEGSASITASAGPASGSGALTVTGATVTNRVTLTSVTPSSPATLAIPDDRVDFTFDYTTNEADGVLIFGRPMSGGSLSPSYSAHSPALHPVGSGSGQGFFRITAGTLVAVDQIRLRMVSAANQSQILFEEFIPVSYTFTDADPIVDQENSLGSGTTISCSGGGSQFQSFTPGLSPLVRVELRFRAGGGFPEDGTELRVRIRSGGSPTGTILATASTFVEGPVSTGARLWVPFDFSPSLHIASGEPLIIEWFDTTPATVLTWFITDDTYAGGTAFFCGGTLRADRDMEFRTYSLPQ